MGRHSACSASLRLLISSLLTLFVTSYVISFGKVTISLAYADEEGAKLSNLFYGRVETAYLRSHISGSFGLTSQEQQTINLINQRRAAMGLRALRVNNSLVVASRRHSNDVGPKGLCQHNGTNRSSPWDRIDQAGYAGSAMGEVVGCGYNSPKGVVGGWWHSSGHYTILTDPSAREIGCGWWVDKKGYGWQTCDTGHSN